MRSTGRFIIVHFVHVIMMCFKRHWSGFFLGIDSSGAGLMESLWLKKKKKKNVSSFLFTYFNFPFLLFSFQLRKTDHDSRSVEDTYRQIHEYPSRYFQKIRSYSHLGI